MVKYRREGRIKLTSEGWTYCHLEESEPPEPSGLSAPEAETYNRLRPDLQSEHDYWPLSGPSGVPNDPVD